MTKEDKELIGDALEYFFESVKCGLKENQDIEKVFMESIKDVFCVFCEMEDSKLLQIKIDRTDTDDTLEKEIRRMAYVCIRWRQAVNDRVFMKVENEEDKLFLLKLIKETNAIANKYS
jgi:hypothetical protein